MVTIKSTNRRHEFWVSNGEYSAVKRELYRKVNAAGNFYFGVRKPVAIYGRSFSDEQKQDLREMLNSNFRIKNVLFSDDFSSEESLQGHTLRPSAAETKRSVFLTETVRNGQRIVSGADIVIAGDVNAGAELIAEGNIAVVGKLRGLAHAGANGDKSACIAATQMLSNQIRIADKIAIMPERKKTEGPELASYIGDNIVITPLY